MAGRGAPSRCLAALLAVVLTGGVFILVGPGAPAAADPPPLPTATTSVIEITVGGDLSVRDTTGSRASRFSCTTGLVRRRRPSQESWSSCTSDEDGTCFFVVPNTNVAPNAGRRFWVVRTGAVPDGWFASDFYNTENTEFAFYRFRTPGMTAQETYRSGNPPFMSYIDDRPGGNPSASSGTWTLSRDNPPPPDACGRDIALILDLSVPPADEEAFELLKERASAFVDVLEGTPSRIALFTTTATSPAPRPVNANRPLTSVSTADGADQVRTWIDRLTSDQTGTNWAAAFTEVEARAETFDLAVLLTDRSPTQFGNAQGSGRITRFAEVEQAVLAANAVKAEGTRVVAIEVPSLGGPAANLQAITGPVAAPQRGPFDNGFDYFQARSYPFAGQALSELAVGPCRGTLTVVKQVTSDGNVNTAVPAGGWEFRSSSPVTPETVVTTPETGTATFDVSRAAGRDVTITETPQPGTSLLPRLGRNASCRVLDHDTTYPSPNVGDTGFSLTSPTRGVTCVVYNRVTPQSLTVTKTWVINGTRYAEGSQPAGLAASLVVNGAPQPWAVPRYGLPVGGRVPVTETLASPPAGCALESQRVTPDQRATGRRGASVPDRRPEWRGDVEITNTLDCETRLTLRKIVRNSSGGTASADAWTLSATSAQSTVTGVSETPPVTRVAVEPGDFTLAETGPSGYAGVWSCVGATARAEQVSLPRWSDVTCTVTNTDQPGSLTLRKTVLPSGAGNPPADWTLTATPLAISGQDAVSGSGDPALPGGVNARHGLLRALSALRGRAVRLCARRLVLYRCRPGRRCGDRPPRHTCLVRHHEHSHSLANPNADPNSTTPTPTPTPTHDPNSNPNPNADTHAHTDAHPNADTNPDTNPDADTNPHTDTNPDADAD